MLRWKLQTQILFLVTFLIAVMLGILVYSTFERAKTARIDHAERTQALADVIAARLDQVAIDSRDLLTVLANLPVLQRVDQMSCDVIGDKLDFAANVYANAALFDRGGHLTCSTIQSAHRTQDSVADLEWFKAAVARPGFHISRPLLDPLSGNWVVMFSYPIDDAQGELVGVLGLPVNLRALGQNLVPPDGPSGQALTVLDATGRVVVRVPDPDRWLGKSAHDQALFSRQAPDDAGLIEDVGLDGVRRYYGREVVPVTGWSVHFGVPVAYVQGPVNQQLRRGLWVTLGATLLAVGFAIVVTRRILRPLRRLVSGIGTAASETQLRNAIGDGPPEIRRLAAELVSAIESRHAAQQRERVLAKVLESANEVIFMTDKDNKITAVNHAFETVTGYSEAEALGRDPGLLGSGRHDIDFHRALWADLEANGAWQGEIWNRRKSGEVFPAIQAISRVRDEAGEVCHVAVMLDISRQREIEQELEHLAQHDPLTGLPNRAAFVARLEVATERNRRTKHKHVAVLCLDVDAFKDVNDTLGHPAGDGLLVQVAQRLEACFDAGQTLCRSGGDEFLVILEGLADPDALVPVIVRIQQAMQPPFLLDDREVSITLSLGISLHPDHADKVTELVSFADAATHRAKRQGKGGYAFYTEDMTQEAERRLSLEHDLRRALIQREEFFLVYQPQLSLHDGSIVGCEALVRWDHPVRGVLSPLEFIPLAEQTGLIEQVTQWVVDEACRQVRQWQDRAVDPPRVGINLSGQHLGNGRFAEFLQQALTRHGVAPDRIDVEITESALIEDPDPARTEIAQLQALGCRVSIDDFGTGYSSLSYLKQFNANVLKIDRAFISRVDRDPSSQGIARAVIAVGHALNMEVLAEGVEQAAEQQWLHAAGCDLLQGYHFCRPVPAAEFIDFFDAWHNRDPAPNPGRPAME